jgi:tripartite-type tricarboxylate transporter receptor subunit TctC
MLMRLTRRAVLAACLGCLLLTQAAVAQSNYPRRPVSLVVTFAAGGGTDVLARIAAKYLSEELGRPVNVVNKPGGNSIPGAMSVLSAAPDGYNLLFDSPATSSLHALVDDLPYRVDQRTWGPLLTTGPYIYAANAKSPWKTLKDMAEASRKNPESLRIAWLGGTSFTDTTMLMLLSVAGIDASKVKKVPFAGSGPGMVALAGGHIDLSGGNIGAATSLIASGDVRALAVTGDERVPALADVPSSREAGIYIPLTSWNAISGPPGMPEEIVKRLDEAVQRMVKRPDYIKDLAAVGNLPAYKAPAAMSAFIQDEVKALRSLR